MKTADIGSRTIAKIYSSAYAHPLTWLKHFNSRVDGHTFLVRHQWGSIELYSPHADNWQLETIVKIFSVLREYEAENCLSNKEMTDWIRGALARANLGIVRRAEDEESLPLMSSFDHSLWDNDLDDFVAIRCIRVEVDL